MSVLYRSDYATVFHDDARDVLGNLTTETFDLIVTDPPYGVEWQSNRRTQAFELLDNDGAGQDDRAGIRAVIAECVRLVGQNRHLYVFGPTDVLEGLKVSEVVALVWDKATLGAGDMTSAWGPSHEDISFTVSKHRHGGKAGDPATPARLRKGTVLRYPRPTGRKVRHPSEKPVALLRELIESSSRQGETVLDPFGGVGSTAVAAILAGRRAVTVELSLTYATIAVERIQAAELLARQAGQI